MLKKNHLFIEGGLVSDVFSIFVVNAILPAIFNLLNPYYFLKKYNEKKLKKDGMNSFTTQAEANQLFVYIFQK